MRRPDAAPAERTRRVPVAPPRTAPPASENAEARVVIVGAAADLPRALAHPAVESGRFAVVATYVCEAETGLEDGVRDSIEALFDQLAADSVLLAGPVAPSVAEWATDVVLAHGASLWAVMPTATPEATTPRVIWPASAPLVELARERRPLAWVACKRAMDFAGAVVGLVLVGPIVAVLAALVSLETPGAPVFRHVRVARGGRRFGCLKLRTMYVDAQERLADDSGLYELYRQNGYKIPEDLDPRITPLGRFLRRTSLDELPQLWNIFTGDMSLVGPRPIVPEELEHYPGARCRLLLSVRPGLTGSWAVGGRHSVGYPRRAEVELAYVRGWSPVNDLRILVRTAAALRRY